MQHTPVLIIGGSLVGLSASLFLSLRGVPHVLVEKHAGSSPHPRAMGFTEHTLEYFRACGLGDAIPHTPPDARLQRVTADSLAGTWGDTLPWTPGEPGAAPADFSPCRGAAIAQDRLEPILREATRARGADLRYGHRLCEWQAVDDGVVAVLEDRSTGERSPIHARWLLACDGADSPIREQLGIAREGVGHLRTLRSVLFRCEQADAWLARGVQQFQIVQPALQGFLTTYGDSRWVLMFNDDQLRSDDELHAAVRKALGADMPVELLATGRWELAGRIARTYREGNVFLLGDAAHQLPPTRGGFGANTGIDDAWNLAWKLQLVLQGVSNEALLDSYSSERQPIGWLRHQQTFARPDYARWVDTPVQAPLYGNAAMELGQLQRSAIVIGAGADLPPAAAPDEWKGQPGTRAPHRWVQRDGVTVSTVDLFVQHFTLVSEDPQWLQAARDAAAKLGLPLATLQPGVDLVVGDSAAFRDAFGIGPHGATLVRPDGVVAWRQASAGEDALAMMMQVLRTVACVA
ncbi:FAD-dependent monooxygenase [Stenotrophomonas sp. 24(2023)]|uniref:FAD-dependent monooxygenase n=1 Tax=Stenotrophomonas sp. 24(2023) TaxID=3068324 RepID=UPI0027DEF3B5|nr:FAD-dependent monooxygenase [Stenotrophomonas sp. 24(2023)]WMJ69678.1 FAD-dependent monooxygenase [Stenotrophomonas sp. 24(2023)]